MNDYKDIVEKIKGVGNPDCCMSLQGELKVVGTTKVISGL